MQIKEINATKLPDIGIKRVAAYARVSSEKGEALHSLSAQISYYNEYISNHIGWEFAGVYADEGISGTKDSRPEFQRLLADCRKKRIDLVITKSITRFARNTVMLLDTIRELKLLNIDVLFEKENLHSLGVNGELMLTLLAMYAEEEARSASENQKWRIQKMFEEGRPNTGRMLGYCLKDGQLTIIPEEAEIVRMIFDDYLSGMGRLAIAKKLNAIHVPTVRGCDDWREGSIYRILHNEKYTGDMILQKTYVEDFRTKKGVINRGEKRKYFVENSHEAIISKKIFERAQAEAERRKAKIKLPEKRMKTIFTGMLICACCGKHFNRRVANASTKYAKPAWICATFMRKGKKYCNNRQIPEKILIAKTKEVLGLPSLEDIDLKDYISEIVCGKDYDLTYIMNSGAEVKTIWHPYSRKDSWNEEMRQQARNRTLERSTLYE